MSQKQIKSKKCRITIEELEKRFNEADLNGDGTLSADEITILLQSLGFDDTYKGTIRKICRYLNKKKKLLDEIQSRQGPSSSAVPHEPQKVSKHPSNNNSEDQGQIKNETEEEKRQRKQLQKKKQQEEAAIGFEEFVKYFQILEKPIGKILYNASLQRSVKVAELCREINIKNMFHKDKGQKLNIKFLVGEEKPSYNSSLEFKIWKESKNQKKQDKFEIMISVSTVSQEKADYLVNGLKEIYQMAIDLITAENQEYSNINEVVKLDGKIQGKIAKIIITTEDEDMKRLISEALLTFDQILETEVTFMVRILYQFNFILSQIKNNQNSVLEDIFARECCLKFEYNGSQFLDAVKEVNLCHISKIALSKNVFELLRIDNDPFLIMLLGFLSMEKGDVFFQFKNLQRKQGSRELTNELISQMAMVNEIQTENFSFQKVADIVDGPITINAVMENVNLYVNIDIQDILKLPFMIQGTVPESDDD